MLAVCARSISTARVTCARILSCHSGEKSSSIRIIFPAASLGVIAFFGPRFLRAAVPPAPCDVALGVPGGAVTAGGTASVGFPFATSAGGAGGGDAGGELRGF